LEAEMAIIPPPCCCQNCDDVFVPPTGCFEVYAPGETPDTDDPIRWVILPYPTEYAYPSGSVVLSCNQLPTTRVIVRWGKEASCGPYGLYALTGEAGDTEEEMTVWPKSYNDLRWFETGGVGRFTIDGDEWLIRRCEGTYYFGEDVPACLYIEEDDALLTSQLPNYWEGSDLCGFITNDEDSTPDTGAIVTGHYLVGWEVDPEQQNVTVTYYTFTNEWTATFTWSRNWWTTSRTLTATDTTTRTLRACSSEDCPELDPAWPECLIDDNCQMKDLNYHIEYDDEVTAEIFGTFIWADGLYNNPGQSPTMNITVDAMGGPYLFVDDIGYGNAISGFLMTADISCIDGEVYFSHVFEIFDVGTAINITVTIWSGP
jgi:hypothetical protein